MANLAKGHSAESRAKANAKMREVGKSTEWREKVSRVTKEALQRPEVRKRHLEGMDRAGRPMNFKGGNGQPLTEVIRITWMTLEPLGWKREFAIKTKGHGTTENPPLNYKADFALPDSKIALELDGPYHLKLGQQRKDRKKTIVLEALGWKVIRLQHS